MKLLGDWNWYLPRWLSWLPRVSHEPKPPVGNEPDTEDRAPARREPQPEPARA
jgi:hypothetical protein